MTSTAPPQHFRFNHQSALKLCRTIQNADEKLRPRLIQEAQRLFQEVLDPHFQREDKELLPHLTGQGEHQLAYRNRQAHQRLRQLVQHLHHPGGLELFADALNRLLTQEEAELQRLCQSKWGTPTQATGSPLAQDLEH